jgi:hypothetical protein
MTIEEGIALAIVAAAATWLVVRWRRRGLADHEEAGGCAACPREPITPTKETERAARPLRTPRRP